MKIQLKVGSREERDEIGDQSLYPRNARSDKEDNLADEGS